MSWGAECIVNTVIVPPEADAELWRRFNYEDGTVDNIYVENLYEDGSFTGEDHRLRFDSNEGVDYTTTAFLDALIELGGRGRICFGDIEGAGAPSFWGYDLTDAGVVELRGSIAWSVDTGPAPT